MRTTFVAIALAVGLASCQPAEPLVVSGAEFRPPLGSSGIGAGYFTITSATSDRIVAVTSDEADSIEIHASVTVDNRSSMKRLETVELPAGKAVQFAPGGMHLMVFSPRRGRDETALSITIELQSGVKKTVPFKIAGGD
jgi:copper(I)-binding protein